MAYPLIPGNATLLEERMFATAQTITFSTFTSCIGVIARAGNQLTAVHLVAALSDTQVFDQHVVAAVNALLPPVRDEIKVVGCISVWRTLANGLAGPFNQLIGLIGANQLDQLDKDMGHYVASTLNSGPIVITHTP